jgi:hypothetical protein
VLPGIDLVPNAAVLSGKPFKQPGRAFSGR